MEPEVTMHKIFDLQVCIPEDWTDDQVKKFADANAPAGTCNGWTIMKKGHKYLGGDPERVVCKDRNGFVHVRLEC